MSSPAPARLRRADLLALGTLLALGAIVRLLFALSTPAFLEGDSQSYLLPAWELASGTGFSPELRRTPLYPLFIAAVFRLCRPSLEAVASAQHIVGLATVALTFLIARRLFGLAAAILAGAAVALSAPQLISERYIMTEAVFGLTLALAVLLVLRALYPPAPAAGRALVGGVGIGLAALTRPVAQALLPLALLALLLGMPRWRPALRAAVLLALGYLLVVGPWTIRNLLAHDALTASGGLGRSLIARTVKYDTLFDWKWLSETYGDRDDPDARARMLLYRKRGNIPNSRSVRPYQDALMEELGLSQAQADTVMRSVALEAIARRPLEYLRGSLLFAGQLFLGEEEALRSHWKQRATKDWAEQWDNRLDALASPVAPWYGQEPRPGVLPPEEVARQQRAELLSNLYQPARLGWLLAALFLAGTLTAAWSPSQRPALLLSAVVLTQLAASAFLDGPVPRYRYPLDPLIAVVASGGLVAAARLLWRQRSLTPRASTARLGRGPVLQKPRSQQEPS